MSYDDDEALFEDIYGEDETPVTESKKDEKKDEVKESSTSEEVKASSEEGNTKPEVSAGESKGTEESSTGSAIGSASGTPAASSATTESTYQQAPLPPPAQAPVQIDYSQQQQQHGSYPPPQQQQQPPQQYQYQQQPPQPPQQQYQYQQQPPQPPQPPQQPMPPSNMGREHGKMFIGGLNWDTTEQGLKEYFSKFGEVVDFTIMRDNATGKSRGFGFLTFRDPSSVDEVIKTDHVLDGKLIDPKRAIARDEQDKVGKIFVGGIDPMVNEKDFNDFFSQFGSIIDAQLMIDKDTGRSRGFGFITYDSPEAVDRVTVNKYLTLKGKSMEVKRAEPRGQHQQNSYQPQNQYGNYNAQYGQPYQQQQNFGTNGMSPDMMQEYWQRMQQWYMYQQQAAAGGQTEDGQQPGELPQQPLNPQEQNEDRSAPPPPPPPQYQQDGQQSQYDRDSSYPSGPKRMPPRGPRGPRGPPPSGPSGGSRGRGGYRGRDRDRGGYHPYSKRR
ncbi:nuclear polyadenylated RNA-binding protein 4 [[Candida] anglica]|uniref:Nuclear polyadenylated RNA-binding protein 4 n=1 Tax=[Candida] anglica TaxID=148631 RepID=A0ABP0ENE1_9ASCO